MKNKYILIFFLLLILVTLTIFIFWSKNTNELNRTENKKIEIIKNPNIIIHSDSVPNIEIMDSENKKNIFQGLASGITINEVTGDVNLSISNEIRGGNFYLTVKLKDIEVLENNNILRTAMKDDLQKGSIFKVVGGERYSCIVPDCYIKNFQQVILISKPVLESEKIYTGSFKGDVGGGGFGFILDDNQGLKIDENSEITITDESQKYYLKLENMAERLLLPNADISTNIIPAGKATILGVAVCPTGNYHCFIIPKEVNILSFRDTNPGDMFHFEGKLVYKFDDYNNDYGAYIYLQIPKSNGSFFTSDALFVNLSTKIYLYSGSEPDFKRELTLEEYKKIQIYKSDQIKVKADGVFICPPMTDIIQGIETFTRCRYIVNTLILKMTS